MKHKAVQHEHLRYLVRKSTTRDGHAPALEVLSKDGSILKVKCYSSDGDTWIIKDYDYKKYKHYRWSTRKDKPLIDRIIKSRKLECL